MTAIMKAIRNRKLERIVAEAKAAETMPWDRSRQASRSSG
jgi:hypothetical protein